MNKAFVFIPATNSCEPNPCQNGGTCTDNDGTPVCTCPKQYTGDKCEGLSLKSLLSCYAFNTFKLEGRKRGKQTKRRNIQKKMN